MPGHKAVRRSRHKLDFSIEKDCEDLIKTHLSDLADRIDVSYSSRRLLKEELDACESALANSKHSILKILPNHHIDVHGELRGYMFQCHAEEKAEILPICKDMFNLTAAYECVIPSKYEESNVAFHPDALRIVNDTKHFHTTLSTLTSSLQSAMCKTAKFDCICEHVSDDTFMHHTPDVRQWAPSLPSRIGLYHAFVRTNTKDKIQHKLFIVVSGCLRSACEEFQNIWHDCKQHLSCSDFVSSEEAGWLREATLRNHNRLAYEFAQSMQLTVHSCLDYQDASDSEMMALPCSINFKNDMRLVPNSQLVQIVDSGCFLPDTTNGVLFEMFKSEGYWLFCGPHDFATGIMFGTICEKAKSFPCMPNMCVRLHHRYSVSAVNMFASVVETHTGINTDDDINDETYDDTYDNRANATNNNERRQTDGSHTEHYLFPDEAFMTDICKLAFERNDGVIHLMPIIAQTCN